MKSKTITLSAISTALIAISLSVGNIFEIADLFALVLSSVFVLLPLYFNSYLGSFLAYIAGGLLSFLCGALFNIYSIVLPSYFTFFGIYPIIKILFVKKNFNKICAFILGLIWCVIVSYGIYFYYTMLLGGVFENLPYWLIDYVVYLVGVFGIIFFVLFDRFILVVKKFIDRYLTKVIK